MVRADGEKSISNVVCSSFPASILLLCHKDMPKNIERHLPGFTEAKKKTTMTQIFGNSYTYGLVDSMTMKEFDERMNALNTEWEIGGAEWWSLKNISESTKKMSLISRDERSSKGCRNHKYYLWLLSIIAYFDFKVHQKGLTISRGDFSEGDFLKGKICCQYALSGIANLQNLTRKAYSFTKYFLSVSHNKSIHFLESIIKLRKTVAVACLFDLMYTHEIFKK